jgi:hypothetical protein
MKPVITFLMVLFTILISAQKTYNLDQKPVKTKEQQIGKALITSDKAIYKKLNYNVYKTEKGKLFIVYPNKENTGYNKKYIKEST